MEIKKQITNKKSKVEMITISIRKKPKRHSLQSAVCGLRSAFTLMEMLVVLAVIGLLTGLLFPALMGARERAKITRARSEIQTIQQAFLAYRNTYGQFPGHVEMTPDAVKELGGANPYMIAFMEFDVRHETEGFLDPWRKPYQIEIVGAGSVETDWFFTTRAHCINKARYRY